MPFSDLDRVRLRTVLDQLAAALSSKEKPDKGMALFAKRLDLYLGIALKLLLAGLALLLVINFVAEVYRPVYRITTFRVSKELTTAGYSGEALRDAYVYELTRIVAQSRGDLRRITRFDIIDKKFDFQIPRTSFSFQALVEYFRDWIGPGDVIVTAAVIKHGKNLRIVTLISDPKAVSPYDNLESEADEPNTLIHENALKAMIALDPYVAGNFLLKQAEAICQPHCQRSNFLDASKVLENAAESSKSEIRYEALLGLADMAAICDEHESAAQYAAAAVATIDDRFEAYEREGVEFKALAETDKRYSEKARTAFRQARKINSKSPFTYVDEAELDVRDGNFKTAIDLDLKALKYWPDYPDGNSALGVAYYRDTQYDNAVTYLSRATMLEPREERHHRDLADALREQASQQMSLQRKSGNASSSSAPDYTAALAEHREALKLALQKPEDRRNLSYAHLDYAKTLAAMGNFEQALSEMDNAICADPSYDGNYKDALEIEKKAGQAPPVSKYSSHTPDAIDCRQDRRIP